MLSIWTWILLSCTSILGVGYIAATQFFRKRRPGEPPIVKGKLFWGSAVEFGTHAVKYLQKCHKTYGNVFTIRLINQHLTIIMDPHSYDAMSREKNFDFDPIQRQVNLNVFSFVLKNPRKMIKDTGRTVKGQHMVKGLEKYTNNVDIACDRVWGGKDEQKWHNIGLRELAADTIFDALFNSIFGNPDKNTNFTSQSVYKNFELFHEYFNYFWLGVPKKLFPAAMKALTELLDQPLSEDFLNRADCSEYIKTAVSYMKGQGQTENEIKGHNLVYLHVNYNTFRLAFWVLSYLLEDEKAYAALMDEIHEFVEDRKDDASNTAAFTVEDIESMKVLDSVVQETARLSSGVFMVRYINKDTQFTTDSGEEFLMREGDRVALYPPAIHKDPEIFEDPMTFKHDRFVDAKFYKNNKEVKHPVMAFGSLCPGQRYAILQLKWYLMTVLTRFDLFLHEGEHAEFDDQYHGHEILPPVSDVKCSYKQKTNFCHIEFRE